MPVCHLGRFAEPGKQPSGSKPACPLCHRSDSTSQTPKASKIKGRKRRKSHSFPEVVSVCSMCSPALPQAPLPAARRCAPAVCQPVSSHEMHTDSHSSTTQPSLHLSCCACHKGKTKITRTRGAGRRRAVRGCAAALAARWSLSGRYPSVLAVRVSSC